MMQPATGMLVLLLLAASTWPCAIAEIAMVLSIHRHGARNLLPKNAFLNDAGTLAGPLLLPQGQRECYNVGATYRQRYLTNTTCNATSTCLLRWLPGGSTGGDNFGVIYQPGVGFSNYNSFFLSSELARTVQSENSFLAGVFPPIAVNSNVSYQPNGEQSIPVYTEQDPNDQLIRAYTKCPTYDNRLEVWYTSPEFLDKNASTADFRGRIEAQILACNNSCDTTLDTSLSNWFNVWDAFYTWRNYDVGAIMPLISDTDFQQVQDLAFWLEVRKMKSNLTGSLLGGPLLYQLSSYLTAAAQIMEQATATTNSTSFFQLVGFSAHYNTVLGVLGALGLDMYQPAVQAFQSDMVGGSWLSTGNNNSTAPPKLPNEAAYILFELHAPSTVGNGAPGQDSNLNPDGSDLAVRLVLQDGPSADFIIVPLPCSGTATFPGPDACSLPSFLSWVESKTLDDSAWCNACQNNSTDFCSSVALQASLEVQQEQYSRLQSQYSVLQQQLSTPLSLPPPPPPNHASSQVNPTMLLVLPAVLMALILTRL